MTTLHITRGLPASGKTNWAKIWVLEDVEHRTRVSRDDYREMLYGRPAPLPNELEVAITKAQTATVRALLMAGRDVVVDATHLRLRHARDWADLAVELGVDFEVHDFPIDVDVAVMRDHRRGLYGGRSVGEDVIRDMAKRFHNPFVPVLPSERAAAVGPKPYTGTPGAPKAWIVDIDGTLAHMQGRSPYSVGDDLLEDTVDETVLELVRLLNLSGHIIILMSGRDDAARDVTRRWLADHGVPWNVLLMRPEGNRDKDFDVKARLFDQHVRDRYDVVGALDDRDQVVKMWRGMGLKTLQVAEGAF